MEFFDTLETREPAAREAALMAALAGQIAHAQKNSTAMAEVLREVDSSKITSRAALSKLPITRKSE